MDVVCGLTAFMVTQNKKINENNKQTPPKKEKKIIIKQESCSNG